MSRNPEERAVSEIMTRDIHAININEGTWSEAARKMSRKGFHHLLVVDDEHVPLTVLSTFDFLEFAYSDLSERRNEVLKQHLINRRLVTIAPDAKLREAVIAMDIHHVDSLVVLSESGMPAGIVTSRDLMNGVFEVVEME